MRIVKAEKTYTIAPTAAKQVTGNAKMWEKFHAARKCHFMADINGEWEEVVTIAYPSQHTAILRVKPNGLGRYMIAASTQGGYGYHRHSAAVLESFRKLGYVVRGLSGGEGERSIIDMATSWIVESYGPAVNHVMIVGE